MFQLVQMKYLNGYYYVEVKDKRYIIRPNENIILRKVDPPKKMRRTQYQVQMQVQYQVQLK